MFFNPLILVSDQDRMSLYNINTRSGTQSMGIKIIISYRIINWFNTKFSKLTLLEFYFIFCNMPLALLSRVCFFEKCNTCCTSINQFSCLLSSDQTSNTFSNDNSVLSDGSQKNWVNQQGKWNRNSRSFDAHNKKTQQQESRVTADCWGS